MHQGCHLTTALIVLHFDLQWMQSGSSLILDKWKFCDCFYHQHHRHWKRLRVYQHDNARWSSQRCTHAQSRIYRTNPWKVSCTLCNPGLLQTSAVCNESWKVRTPQDTHDRVAQWVYWLCIPWSYDISHLCSWLAVLTMEVRPLKDRG